MRWLRRLAFKFAKMVIILALMGAALRYARPYIMKTAGMPEGTPGAQSLEQANFSSEESDLMATVFKSALRFLSGSAKREDLASELSDKLYAGRADSTTMSELGIELVKPGGDSSAPTGGLVKPRVDSPAAGRSTTTKNSLSGANVQAIADASSTTGKQVEVRKDILGQVWEKAMANPEIALVPIVLFVMIVVRRVRRRTPEDDLVLPDFSKLIESDAEPFDMTNAVNSLQAEEFELLVARIYQLQGYRVSMPAALSGGNGGDFTLRRKSEQLLVQCKKFSPDYKVPVERVRELHEAAVAAGAKRGVYVASCGFSWDARNFAKSKGVTVINARMLDTLITEARGKSDEDLLTVAQWVSKFMSKVQLTPPVCPSCEATMDLVNSGSVWVCSQRPECRGRRSARIATQAPPSEGRASASPQTSEGSRTLDTPTPPKQSAAVKVPPSKGGASARPKTSDGSQTSATPRPLKQSVNVQRPLSVGPASARPRIASVAAGQKQGPAKASPSEQVVVDRKKSPTSYRFLRTNFREAAARQAKTIPKTKQAGG